MDVNWKSRDLPIDDDRDYKRSIKLVCRVHGIEQDFWDSRTPRNVKYSLKAYSDSIGTALQNLYEVSLVMIERALIEEDSTNTYKSLAEVKVIYDEDEQDRDKGEIKVKSREEIEAFLAAKLMNLQIGGELDLSFDDIEVTFEMKRFDP